MRVLVKDSHIRDLTDLRSNILQLKQIINDPDHRQFDRELEFQSAIKLIDKIINDAAKGEIIYYSNME